MLLNLTVISMVAPVVKLIIIPMVAPMAAPMVIPLVIPIITLNNLLQQLNLTATSNH